MSNLRRKKCHPFFPDLLGEFWAFCCQWGRMFPNSQHNRWTLVQHLENKLRTKYAHIKFELICDHGNNADWRARVGVVTLDAMVLLSKKSPRLMMRLVYPAPNPYDVPHEINMEVREVETQEVVNIVTAKVPEGHGRGGKGQKIDITERIIPLTDSDGMIPRSGPTYLRLVKHDDDDEETPEDES